MKLFVCRTDQCGYEWETVRKRSPIPRWALSRSRRLAIFSGVTWLSLVTTKTVAPIRVVVTKKEVRLELHHVRVWRETKMGCKCCEPAGDRSW